MCIVHNFQFGLDWLVSWLVCCFRELVALVTSNEHTYSFINTLLSPPSLSFSMHAKLLCSFVHLVVSQIFVIIISCWQCRLLGLCLYVELNRKIFYKNILTTHTSHNLMKLHDTRLCYAMLYYPIHTDIEGERGKLWMKQLSWGCLNVCVGKIIDLIISIILLYHHHDIKINACKEYHYTLQF